MFINLSIDLYKELLFNFLNITAFVTVSGNPPLLLIITAHPLLDASKLVLPNGSSHLEHTTVMLDFLKLFKTILCFLKPNISRFLCLKINFSLGSSP